MCYATHNMRQLCTTRQLIHLRTGNKKHILYMIYYLHLRTSYKTVLGGTTIEKANTIMMIIVVALLLLLLLLLIIIIIIIIILIIIDFLQTHTVKQHPNTHTDHRSTKKTTTQNHTTPHPQNFHFFLVETYLPRGSMGLVTFAYIYHKKINHSCRFSYTINMDPMGVQVNFFLVETYLDVSKNRGLPKSSIKK